MLTRSYAKDIVIPHDRYNNLSELLRMFEIEKDQIRLDMKQFEHECGSPSCAIGYAAYWQIGEAIQDENHDYPYTEYSTQFLPLGEVTELFSEGEGVDKLRYGVNLWDYLFAYENTNSVSQFIHRLTWVLEGDCKRIADDIEKYIGSRYPKPKAASNTGLGTSHIRKLTDYD